MASVYDLKPRFQQLLRPLVRLLAARGVTPNQLTLLALGGSFLVGGALLLAGTLSTLLLMLPIWLLVRMALNALDGMMARELGMTTRLGGILNEVGDVVSDLALYVPLAWYEPGARTAVLTFALLAVLTEFCGLMGVLVGTRRQYQGPMGKSDRALAVSLLAIATATLPLMNLVWALAFWSLSALECLTCWNRAAAAIQEAAKAP